MFTKGADRTRDCDVQMKDNADRLRQFLREHEAPLLVRMRHFVRSANLAHGADVQDAAVDLLADVTVQAIEHAGRFDGDRQPMAWILGIAANLVRQRQAAAARQFRRESFIRDLAGPGMGCLTDEELFDRVARVSAPGPQSDLEDQESVDSILSLVDADDREVLRLAILCGLSGAALASALGIRPGAARSRLHRALNRLRQAWSNKEADDDGG